MRIKKLTLTFGAAILGVLCIMARNTSAAPYAFPVPFIEKEHSEITFKDLPGPGSIKILTINGEELIRLDIAPGELLKHWNVLNSSGKHLATGVYIYLIDAGGQTTTGKLVVIR
jgi:hypothetical protein